jgi:primosomal protein N' (replication factor Y) (superfamily II helicase)
MAGPPPSPVERIKNRRRWHLLLQPERSKQLTRVGSYFMQRFGVPKQAGVRIAVDRDSVALL